jgi:hypothetical protein
MQSQSKNQTSDGSETRPAERSKNQTKEKTLANDTFKQQHASAPSVVAASNLEAYRLLRDAGFDEPTATKMAQLRTAEEIEQQIAWLDARKSETNRPGLLRRAIEENWAARHAMQQTEKQKLVRERERQREAEQAAAVTMMNGAKDGHHFPRSSSKNSARLQLRMPIRKPADGLRSRPSTTQPGAS